MKRTLVSLVCLLTVCISGMAQESHRDSVLLRARYLKSIYKTDEAIENLSSLVSRESFDEEV